MRFEHAEPDLTAQAASAVVLRLQERLVHRYCEIWDEGTARRLVPGLEALGATVEDRILLMEAPPAGVVTARGFQSPVEEADGCDLDSLYLEWLMCEEIFAADPELTRTAMRARSIRFDTIPTLAWCVRDDDGTPVAMAHLMEGDDGSAMIEDVYCTPALRRRGFGAACVHAAVRAARDAGRDPVFLPTDVAGPAPDFYAALGFRRGEVITRVLLRSPA